MNAVERSQASRERRAHGAARPRRRRLPWCGLRAGVPSMDEVDVGSPPRPGSLRRSPALAGAMKPCKPRGASIRLRRRRGYGSRAGRRARSPWAHAGVSLLRPLLVDWPTSQVDPSRLHGESKQDHGWAAAAPRRRGRDRARPAARPRRLLGARRSASRPACRTAGALTCPGRLNRPIAEVNVGLPRRCTSTAAGNTGGAPLRDDARPGAAVADLSGRF